MNTKSLIFALLFVAALSLSWWVIFTVVQKNLTKLNTQPNQPDTFMRGVSYLKMDKQGKLTNQISTAQVVHYPLHDEYIFTSPKIKMRDEARQIWQIQAASGKSQAKETTIDLWGNVLIQQLAKNTPYAGLTIKTNTLTFYPQKNYAVTSDKLLVTQPGNKVTSIGATLDFKKGALRLLSKVQGQYVPEDGSK